MRGKYGMPYKLTPEQAREQFVRDSSRMFESSRRKLTWDQRMEIGYRRMEGEKSIDLAVEYGVSRGTIDQCSKMERPYD